MAAKFIIKRDTAAGSPAEPPLAEKIFDGPMATIGSDQAATLQLNGQGVAPEQAVIVNEDGQLLLINQADGTRLNDETLAREAIRPLAHGDHLRVGAYLIEVVFYLEQAEQTSQSNAAPSVENLATTQPAENSPAATEKAVSQRSFASILDSLRTEEDSFYFTIEDGSQGAQRRIQIESAEMPLGWNETGQHISCDAASIVAPRGVVRKDWSGVVVQAESAGTVMVNGEPVESVRRLRNGDRVTLLPTAIPVDPERHFLIFHEPASLIVLDSLLPQKLPPPVAVGSSAAQKAGQGAATTLPERRAQALPTPKAFDLQRKYFGYFTLLELLVMACGTLVAAVIIFLILEYS